MIASEKMEERRNCVLAQCREWDREIRWRTRLMMWRTGTGHFRMTAYSWTSLTLDVQTLYVFIDSSSDCRSCLPRYHAILSKCASHMPSSD